ncbi:MAG TPA: hypothetical protein VMS17_13470 [Gemmataceae bacterium]|nr:hypothetical protein [Gemmataceae bacterium]
MKRWSLLYLTLAAALLAGLAHLRADWLAASAAPTASPPSASSAVRAAGREEPRMLWSLLRSR